MLSKGTEAIVMMALHGWPAVYPDFIRNIETLCQVRIFASVYIWSYAHMVSLMNAFQFSSPNSIPLTAYLQSFLTPPPWSVSPFTPQTPNLEVLGMRLVRMANETLASPPSCVPAGRALEAKTMLATHMGQLMSERCGYIAAVTILMTVYRVHKPSNSFVTYTLLPIIELLTRVCFNDHVSRGFYLSSSKAKSTLPHPHYSYWFCCLHCYPPPPPPIYMINYIYYINISSGRFPDFGYSPLQKRPVFSGFYYGRRGRGGRYWIMG